MNTNEILARAEEIRKIIERINKMKEIKNVLATGSEKVIMVKYKGCLREDRIEVNTSDEICNDIYKAFEKQTIKEENKLHEINGEPLEEIQEQKTNYIKIDTILKEINKDEYEDYVDKEELLLDYLNDYKSIREIVMDNYDYIGYLVDKNTNIEYNKLVSGLVTVIKRKSDEISDLAEENSELENENKKLSRELLDELSNKNILINQIKEHIKEMDLICRAH